MVLNHQLVYRYAIYVAGTRNNPQMLYGAGLHALDDGARKPAIVVLRNNKPSIYGQSVVFDWYLLRFESSIIVSCLVECT